jgi:hypothetical protein
LEPVAQKPLSPKERLQGLTNWEKPELLRKFPQREGITTSEIAEGRRLFQQSRDQIAKDIDELKASYVFADDSVSQFLAEHRSLTAVLRSAIQPLKASFGADGVFELEVTVEEDGSKMLYGVALWPGSVRAAAQALDNFSESWWLDHMTLSTTDLAFIYRISR